VDSKHIIIAGFSQGGKMALDIVLKEVLPVSGFIVLQPGVKLSCQDKANLEKLAERGLRGTIIESESAVSSREQQQVEALNREYNLAFRYVISGTGHWYPPDFLKQLDAALSDLLNN
jgi:predicted esterase